MFALASERLGVCNSSSLIHSCSLLQAPTSNESVGTGASQQVFDVLSSDFQAEGIDASAEVIQRILSKHNMTMVQSSRRRARFSIPTVSTTGANDNNSLSDLTSNTRATTRMEQVGFLPPLDLELFEEEQPPLQDAAPAMYYANDFAKLSTPPPGCVVAMENPSPTRMPAPSATVVCISSTLLAHV